MLSKEYSHRLPADYDLSILRRRAAERGPLWDDTPGLAFKAFVLREKGRHGANGNLYASIYLWRDVTQTIGFFSGARFRNVINSFGRPQVELWLPLDARSGKALEDEHAVAGRAAASRWLYRETIAIAAEHDLEALQAEEAQRNRALARAPDTLALVSAIDPAHWQLVRLHVSTAAPDGSRAGDAYEVLYLAQPELHQLAAPLQAEVREATV